MIVILLSRKKTPEVYKSALMNCLGLCSWNKARFYSFWLHPHLNKEQILKLEHHEWETVATGKSKTVALSGGWHHSQCRWLSESCRVARGAFSRFKMCHVNISALQCPALQVWWGFSTKFQAIAFKSTGSKSICNQSFLLHTAQVNTDNISCNVENL